MISGKWIMWPDSWTFVSLQVGMHWKTKMAAPYIGMIMCSAAMK